MDKRKGPLHGPAGPFCLYGVRIQTGGLTMIPATLNPRLLALYGCEMPKHYEREWMHSNHVQREIKKAMEALR